jgi:hypothetical protein
VPNDRGDWLEVAVLQGKFETHAPLPVQIERCTFTSPFAASFSLPLGLGRQPGERSNGNEAKPVRFANWPVVGGFFVFYILVDAGLLASMLWLFNARWRVRYS